MNVLGADGVPGDTPPDLTIAGNKALGFECHDRQTFSFQNGTEYTNYTCIGKKGIPAGSGGDGGCGGFGGDPGVFHIIGLNNATTKINVVNRTGMILFCIFCFLANTENSFWTMLMSIECVMHQHGIHPKT